MVEQRIRKTRPGVARATRRVPVSIMVIAFVFIAGLGYIAGTYNTQIMGSLAPLFGYKTYAGTLDLSSLQQTYQNLKANYDGTLDDDALVEGANKGLVDAVGDPYTVYMNQSESQAFDNDLSGNIGGGVGIELALRNEKVTVLRVLKDNPAEKAGLMVGDVIVSINDQTKDWTVEDAVSRIRGDVDTTVKIVVLRGNATKEFTVTRAEINNPSVYSSVKDGIGTMTITRFDSETSALARQAAQSFKDKNVRGVILDLRGNGGGYVTAAQDVAGLWLKDKVVVTERTDGKVVDELRSASSPLLAGIPTAVLVNESSASASEIVAGALQDYKAAQLVGTKTYGKGSVQKLLSLPGGAELKVTVARWYTPNGKNISQLGIDPDKKVERTTADFNKGRDPQLSAAEALLK